MNHRRFDKKPGFGNGCYTHGANLLVIIHQFGENGVKKIKLEHRVKTTNRGFHEKFF